MPHSPFPLRCPHHSDGLMAIIYMARAPHRIHAPPMNIYFHFYYQEIKIVAIHGHLNIPEDSASIPDTMTACSRYRFFIIIDAIMQMLIHAKYLYLHICNKPLLFK